MALPVAAAVAAVAAGGASAEPRVSAAAACTINDLRLDFLGEQGAAGTLINTFRYAKRGGGSCTLKGYPKVTLLGQSQRPLSIKVRRSKARPVKAVALKKGKGVFFEVTRPGADPKSGFACKTKKVYHYRIQAPGMPQKLTISLQNPELYCAKGVRKTAFGRRR
jgi:hypothetical protein